MSATNVTPQSAAHRDRRSGLSLWTRRTGKARFIFMACAISTLAAVCSVQSMRASHVVAGDTRNQSDQASKPGVSGPNDPQPLEFDDEPDCAPWDGEKVYCDFIGNDLILNGTSDSESIWIEWQFIEAEDVLPKAKLTVLVMHSDASSEYFEFDEVDFMASTGYFDPEDVPPDWMPTLYIKSRCGHDVIVNNSGMETYAELGAGNDFYVGGDGVDIVDGQWGHDTIFGGRESDLVAGGTGQDLLYGGPPPAGLVAWPGAIDWSALAAPYSDSYDGERDEIDCGMDSEVDWLIVEINVTDDGLTLAVDDVVNLDFNSPPGTDHVYH